MSHARRACLLLTGGVLSACVLSRNDVDYDLASAPYLLTYQAVTVDSCFPPGFGASRGSTDLLSIAVQGSSAQVGRFGALAALTSDLTGNYRSNELVVMSRRRLVISTACELEVLSALSGAVFSPAPQLSVGYGVTFDANTTTSAGLPSRCQAYPGTTVNGVPFPTLSNPTNGTCSYGLEGTATLLPPP